MKSGSLIAWSIVLISFLIGALLYPQMPETIASHWNAQGEANGYTSKFWGLFLMPGISAALLFFLLLIPKIDPLRSNIEEFRKYYDQFVVIMMFYLLYLYCLTIAWNLGYRFDMTRMLVPGFALLFYYTGVMLEHAKRNWFIGIRTPWTLSNDLVWQKTHQLGGRLFKIAALISLFGFFIPEFSFLFIIVPVLVVGGYTVFYSYIEYQKVAK